MIRTAIRPLHANPHVRPGTWGEADCADQLEQIASTVSELAKQLDRLWSLARRDLEPALNSLLEHDFERIDKSLVEKVQSLADTFQSIADKEPSHV